MANKKLFGEGKDIEFKREIPKNHEKFLKDVIAFANSSGGTIYLGIEDETGVVYGIGDASPFKLSDAISTMIGDACVPKINPDITHKTMSGIDKDETVLEIYVAPGKFRPYYLGSKGKEASTYIRINGTSRPADDKKIKELELERQRVSYDSMQEIGSNYDEQRAIVLCEEMKRIALDACETEEQRVQIKDLMTIYMEIEVNQVFGANEVAEILGCSPSTAREVIKKLKDMKSVVEVKGQGKGKYRFVNQDD